MLMANVGNSEVYDVNCTATRNVEALEPVGGDGLMMLMMMQNTKLEFYLTIMC